MPQRPLEARAALTAWRDAIPDNAYLADRQLRRLLDRWLPPGRRAPVERWLRAFGAVVMGDLDRAAEVANRPPNLPRLERWSPHGERIEDVEHHPAHDDCGDAIYRRGRVIAAYADPPAALPALAAFYLSSHAGEAGHNCPVACTAGVVRALSAAGSEALKARYLPGLLRADYPDRLHGAQFLTEIQGGSDVGANAVRASVDGEELGTVRVRVDGEKWFCSNPTADLILMTARIDGRPDGTRGLGLLLVPRRLPDGALNGLTLRRLKDKLGTRSMASAEIDFDGAIGFAVGPLDDGFRTVMTHVIHTSRMYNSVGCAGIARRAWLEARAYALHRQAFGAPVATYPLMQAMLASMRATSRALTAGALELAWRQDHADAGTLDAAGSAHLRVATNLVKMRTSQHAHRVALTAIETLGGNGAIETFSILPRLLRDNVVYENWEGTHNTLIAQTLRDFGRLGLHEGLLATLDADLAVDDPAVAAALAPARQRVREAAAALPAVLAIGDAGEAALALRPFAEQLGDAVLAAAQARDAAAEHDTTARAGEIAALAWFVDEQLSRPAAAADAGRGARARAAAGLSGAG